LHNIIKFTKNFWLYIVLYLQAVQEEGMVMPLPN